jgi:BASS family bile acid:Na+ symporter
MNNIAIQILVTATIFSLMFSIGINHSLRELAAVWRKPRWMLRALLVVVILVPLVVGFLVWLFDLPASTAAGLVLLAAAPGAPLLTKRSQMAGADPAFSAGLQLTLAVLAVVITPLCLSVFYAVFSLPIERVALLTVLRQVLMVTFLPVFIGLALHHFVPKVTNIIQPPIRQATAQKACK